MLWNYSEKAVVKVETSHGPDWPDPNCHFSEVQLATATYAERPVSATGVIQPKRVLVY